MVIDVKERELDRGGEGSGEEESRGRRGEERR